MQPRPLTSRPLVSRNSSASAPDQANCDPIYALASLLRRGLENHLNAPLRPDERALRSIIGDGFPNAALPATQNVSAIVETLLVAKQADGLSERPNLELVWGFEPFI